MSLLRVVALLGAAASLVGCGGPSPAVPASTTPGSRARACGSLSRLALGDEPVALLRDRLRIRMPVGTEHFVGRAMLGPRPPDDLETQLELVDGEGRKLRVIAMELFRRPSGALEESVAAWLREGDAATAVDPLELAPPLSGVFAAVEEVGRPGEGLALVGRAVVHGDARALMNVSFFVSPEIVREEGVAPCADLARRLAATLAAGPRPLDVEGGEVALDDRLYLDVPAGYARLEHRGRDFVVHYLYPLSTLDAPHAQLGIYLGREPSSHVRDVLEMRSSTGSLLGRSVEWQLWTTARRGERVHHMETMIPAPESEGGWIHVFLVAADGEQAHALAAIAETLSTSPR